MEFSRGDGIAIATRRELLARGYTTRSLAAEVHAGQLVRVRRGYYAKPDVDDAIQRAVCLGGLLTCVSAARIAGIWVEDEKRLHIHLRHEASRLRSPNDRFCSLNTRNRIGTVLHWNPLLDVAGVNSWGVGPVNALAHIIRCQPEHLAIASIDSALYTRVVSNHQLDQIFAAIPGKYALYRPRVDARAMSGIETVVRLLVIEAGFCCEPQVRFERVGIVDLVVEDCVVIETDGVLGHADAVSRARDYDRDVALVSLGYSVLRFNYRQVMFEPDAVMDAVRAALATHSRFSGRAAPCRPLGR